MPPELSLWVESPRSACIGFISGVSSSFHFIHIAAELKEDLIIWRKFLLNFNGCALWQAPFCSTSALNLWTDASWAVGYVFFWQGHWSADR